MIAPHRNALTARNSHTTTLLELALVQSVDSTIAVCDLPMARNAKHILNPCTERIDSKPIVAISITATTTSHTTIEDAVMTAVVEEIVTVITVIAIEVDLENKDILTIDPIHVQIRATAHVPLPGTEDLARTHAATPTISYQVVLPPPHHTRPTKLQLHSQSTDIQTPPVTHHSPQVSSTPVAIIQHTILHQQKS